MMPEPLACWCGKPGLEPFSPGYARCAACDTLVSLEMPDADIQHVAGDEQGFYGREYWFSHQQRQLGLPTIVERARADLPERCLFWLRTLLRYRTPPARAVEVGSGHGGFAALLRWSGFDATGLEISPWVVEFSRERFEIPVVLGPVEDQPIEAGSLDLVVMMDVLEHLRDPVATMQSCLDLLKPDGIALIQTPCFPAEKSYDEMVAASDRFLEVLQPKEHLFLFSRRAVGELLGRLGAGHVAFEPALFAEYDMFLVASRAPLPAASVREIEAALDRSPAGRMIQALVDLGQALDDLRERHAVSEADRAARLDAMVEQGRRLGVVEAERNNLGAEVTALRQHQATHLSIIEEQSRGLERLSAEVNDLRAETAAQENQIRVVLTHLRALQHLVSIIRDGRAYRVLRRLGFWKWFEEAIARSVPRA
jgi:SAM-dependent methyltransferase